MTPARAVRLASSPICLLMCVVSAYGNEPVALLCSSGIGGLPHGGMTMMYALMALFHSPAWVELAQAHYGRLAESALDRTMRSP